MVQRLAGPRSFLWLNSIPLCGRTTFYLSIPQLMGTGFCPLSGHSELCCSNSFLWIPIFYSLGYILGNGISRSYGNSIFNVLRSHQLVFYSVCTILHSHSQCMKVPIFLHPCRHIFFFAYLLAAFIMVVLVDVKWYLIVVSISISWVTNDAEPLLCPCWAFASLL